MTVPPTPPMLLPREGKGGGRGLFFLFLTRLLYSKVVGPLSPPPPAGDDDTQGASRGRKTAAAAAPLHVRSRRSGEGGKNSRKKKLEERNLCWDIRRIRDRGNDPGFFLPVPLPPFSSFTTYSSAHLCRVNFCHLTFSRYTGASTTLQIERTFIMARGGFGKRTCLNSRAGGISAAIYRVGDEKRHLLFDVAAGGRKGNNLPEWV